jgi:RNA polymerase sigma factor (TIGR02999 family)
MLVGPQETQQLIVAWRGGDVPARDRLIARLLPELTDIAAARMRRETTSSLSTGDLINDAVLRMMRMERMDLVDKVHFIALASRLMRNILTDHARAKNAGKREHNKVELTTRFAGAQKIDLESLDFALTRLAAIDRQLMDIVEMRYFGGMTISDIAQVCGLSEPTVKRRWRVARAWLADAIDGHGA